MEDEQLPKHQGWKEANQLLDMLPCFRFELFFSVFQTFEIFSGDNAAAVSSDNVKRSQDLLGFFLMQSSDCNFKFWYLIVLKDSKYIWRQVQLIFFSTFTSPTRVLEKLLISCLSLKGKEGIKFKNSCPLQLACLRNVWSMQFRLVWYWYFVLKDCKIYCMFLWILLYKYSRLYHIWRYLYVLCMFLDD